MKLLRETRKVVSGGDCHHDDGEEGIRRSGCDSFTLSNLGVSLNNTGKACVILVAGKKAVDTVED